MTVQSKLRDALPYLPQAVQQAVLRAKDPDAIQEIRIRIGRPLQIIRNARSAALCRTDGQPFLADRPMLDSVFRSICAYSVHSWQEGIRQGFITIAGGSRVGLCGTAVLHAHQLETLRTVSGMNIRIASERIGCAESLCKRLAAERGGVLIAGAPASGKTTILRDISRILGETHRICLLDARGELAACRNGVPQFEIGTQTDVFDGYPKAEGIEIAVRVMSPELLICDELGGAEEAEALLQSMHTGVQIIASAHAGSLAELCQRPQIRRLIDAGGFRTGVLLGSGSQCGQVLAIEALRQRAFA